MEKVEDIYDKFIENFKNLNIGDIYCEPTGVLGGTGLSFKSHTRIGKYGKEIFVYLILRSNEVKVSLNSGKYPPSPINDPKSLIVKDPFFPGLFGSIHIKPEEFNTELKNYIDYLVKQCYEMLTIPRYK
jgi:hypothetical protein